MAERCVWDAEVPGSSPGTPTQADNEAETLRAIAGARNKSNSDL